MDPRDVEGVVALVQIRTLLQCLCVIVYCLCRICIKQKTLAKHSAFVRLLGAELETDMLEIVQPIRSYMKHCKIIRPFSQKK